MNFAGNTTLLKIRIENNNSPNYYCNKLEELAQFPNEKEILITCNCIFQITKKKIKKGGINKVNMTCKGFNND